MKKNGLLIILIILCIAAWAAVEIALTASSGSEETVKANFVSAGVYKSSIAGKESVAFDTSVLRFEGSEVPFDRSKNTIYIPQSMEAADWDGKLTVTKENARICILYKGQQDRAGRLRCIKEGTAYKIAIIFSDSCMEGEVVFTGLPAVSLSFDDGEIKGKEEHNGKIDVLDPYRKEYMSSDCSFHVRGNTSVLFDKKSYRVELHDGMGNNAKENLLGLRRDDDWILNALSTDHTLAREKVCYELWKELNKMEEDPVAAPEMEYVELFLNGTYKGVYGLMYPVDRKLMGMRVGDILYKIKTWKEELDAPGELTDYNGQREVLNTNGFAYAEIEYPGKDEGPYDWSPLQAYQDFVFETADLSTLDEGKVSLHTDNFILHELFCELTRAGDNTWKNVYLAAYNNGRGGYTLCETIWDLNYTFGDRFVWDPDNGNTLFDPESTDCYKLRYDRDYGYSTLVYVDEGVREKADDKWKKWREAGIGPDLIEAMFEKQREYLSGSGAAARNEEKWPGSTSPDNSDIYDWLSGRFAFLDELHSLYH